MDTLRLLAYVMPIVGGIVANAKWGRFKTIAVGTTVGAVANSLLSPEPAFTPCVNDIYPWYNLREAECGTLAADLNSTQFVPSNGNSTYDRAQSGGSSASSSVIQSGAGSSSVRPSGSGVSGGAAAASSSSAAGLGVDFGLEGVLMSTILVIAGLGAGVVVSL